MEKLCLLSTEHINKNAFTCGLNKLSQSTNNNELLVAPLTKRSTFRHSFSSVASNVTCDACLCAREFLCVRQSVYVRVENTIAANRLFSFARIECFDFCCCILSSSYVLEVDARVLCRSFWHPRRQRKCVRANVWMPHSFV